MGSYQHYVERREKVIEELENINPHLRSWKNIVNIYFIQNIENKKVYIGRSKYQIEYRFKQHIESAFNPNSDVYNTPLKRDIRKFGKEKFVCGHLDCVLERRKEYQRANALEQEYMKKYNTYHPQGYNVSGLKGKKLKEAKELKEG